MGRRFWGTGTQENLLLQFKREYDAHRRKKKTRKFWPKFFSVWFNTFTEDRLIKRTRMTQCKTWMANHTGTREDGREYDQPPADGAPPPHPPQPPHPSHPPPKEKPSKYLGSRERRRLRKSSRESKILALIRGRPKKYTLPAYQAYSHLYYHKVEQIIDGKWKEHLEKLRDSNSEYMLMSDEELTEFAKDERLTVVNRELRRLYLKESDEIKVEVQDYRQKYAIGFDSMTETERRECAIKNTDSLMKTLLPNLYHETGMIVTVLAAGRSPSSGNVVFRSFHVGKGEFGENFAQWDSSWDVDIKNKYVKYFGAVEKATIANGVSSSLTADMPIGKGVLLQLRPGTAASVDDEDDGVYDDETFGGMDGADIDDVDEKANPTTNTTVDWPALFKANIILNNVDVQITELPSDLLALSPPTSPISTARNVDREESPRPILPPAIPATPQTINPPLIPTSRHNDDVEPASRSSKRKATVEDADEDEDDVPYYVAEAKCFLTEVLGGRCPTIVEHWCMIEEKRGHPESRTRKLGGDKLRPKELTELMIHHDYSKITIPTDHADYGKRWRVWYISLQPSWRGVTWPLRGSSDLPPNCNWKTLSYGGRNSILLVILGLALWLLSSKNLKNSAGRKATLEIEEALKDVDSVLLMMLCECDGKENEGRPTKRPRQK